MNEFTDLLISLAALITAIATLIKSIKQQYHYK